MHRSQVLFAFVSAAILIIPLFFITHLFRRQFSSVSTKDTCAGLLHRGKARADKWIPENCQLQNHSLMESLKCMEKLEAATNRTARIVFVGDSRIRQLRDGMIRQLTGTDRDWLANRTISYDPNIYKKHEDSGMHIPTGLGNVSIEFIWDTAIDGVDFGKFLDTTLKEPVQQRPHLVVFGVGLWPIRFCTNANRTQEVCVQDYKRDLIRYLPQLLELANHSAVFWAPQNLVIEAWWTEDREFKNHFMMMYNDAALDVISESNIIYWNSYVETSRLFNDTLDGIHLGMLTKMADIEILLNFLCNPLDKPFFATNTCCSSSIISDLSNVLNLPFLLFAVGTISVFTLVLCISVRKSSF